MSTFNFNKLVVSLLFFTIIFFLYLFNATFNEKEAVNGEIAYSKEFLVKAPFDGVVSDIYLESNSYISSGEVIATISSLDIYVKDESNYNYFEVLQNRINEKKKEVKAIYSVEVDSVNKSIQIQTKNIDNERLNIARLKGFILNQEEILNTKYSRINKDKEMLSAGVITSKQFEDAEAEILTIKGAIVESKLLLNESYNRLFLYEKEVLLLKNNLSILIENLRSNERDLNEQLIEHGFERLLNISAPFNGYFIPSDKIVNSQVSKGDVIAKIVSDEFIVKLSLDGDSIANMSVGDYVNVSVNAFPYDKHGFLLAQVKKINEVSSYDDITKTHEAELIIVNYRKIKKLRNGMTVKVFVNKDSTTFLRLLLLPVLNFVEKNKEISL